MHTPLFKSQNLNSLSHEADNNVLLSFDKAKSLMKCEWAFNYFLGYPANSLSGFLNNFQTMIDLSLEPEITNSPFD